MGNEGALFGQSERCNQRGWPCCAIPRCCSRLSPLASHRPALCFVAVPAALRTPLHHTVLPLHYTCISPSSASCCCSTPTALPHTTHVHTYKHTVTSTHARAHVYMHAHTHTHTQVDRARLGMVQSADAESWSLESLPPLLPALMQHCCITACTSTLLLPPPSPEPAPPHAISTAPQPAPVQATSTFTVQAVLCVPAHVGNIVLAGWGKRDGEGEGEGRAVAGAEIKESGPQGSIEGELPPPSPCPPPPPPPPPLQVLANVHGLGYVPTRVQLLPLPSPNIHTTPTEGGAADQDGGRLTQLVLEVGFCRELNRGCALQHVII